MRRAKFNLVVSGLAVLLALVLCVGILPPAPAFGNGASTVGMVITPTPKIVTIGNTFSVNITVTISAGEAVNAVEAHINFNTTCLEVVSITPGTALPNLQINLYNNTAGTIDCTGGAAFGAPVTANATLATLNLRAKAITGGTPLTFMFNAPSRNTQAIVGFYDALNHGAVVPGMVTILPLAILNGHVDLQGRYTPPHTDWVTPLTVKFFFPNGTIARTENVTTDDWGNFTVSDVVPGTYNIGVKCPRTLSELVTGVTFYANTTTMVSFGTLREGDASNNDRIYGEDYSQLCGDYGATSAAALDRCDFNRDGQVDVRDYALLWWNFNQVGDYV